MRFALRLALLSVVAMPLFAAPGRLTFERRVPPVYPLAGDRATVIYTLGDSPHLATFLDVFVDEANRAGTYVEDATRERQHFMTTQAAPDTIAELHRNHPSGTYLGVKAFTCRLTEHGGEGSVHDVDGKRTRQQRVWTSAICEARFDVIAGDTVKRLYSFPVKGEGKSARVETITDDERRAALDLAARRVAIHAAESVAPRRIRESIQLDDGAPLFDEGMGLIEAGRLEEARELWRRGLATHPKSEALQFNLGAVSEALGDLENARRHFGNLSEVQRYKNELLMFRRRNGPR